MKVYTVLPEGFGANCYLVTEDGKTAFAVDPAQPRAGEEAERLSLQVTHVLLTHGHYDHICGVAALQSQGAKVGCLVKEAYLALHEDNLGAKHKIAIPPFTVDFTFQDGEILKLCGMTVEVIATPGHTAGSCCFRVGDTLFTGDTLFCGTVGRTDLPTGDMQQLQTSLARLAAIKENLCVLPGHGEQTSLSRERKYNPFLSQLC